jgi:hypothetical protein
MINTVTEMQEKQIAPTVGEGATVYLWSDRHAYDVIDVSADGLRVDIQRCHVSALPGSTFGNWNYQIQSNPHAEIKQLHYRRTKAGWRWYNYSYSIVYTKEFLAKAEAANTYPARLLTEEQLQEVYAGESMPRRVVEGITRLKRNYNPIMVQFGVRDEYFDPHF